MIPCVLFPVYYSRHVWTRFPVQAADRVSEPGPGHPGDPAGLQPRRLGRADQHSGQVGGINLQMVSWGIILSAMRHLANLKSYNTRWQRA